ncbi:MAG: EamA/RhaT family transporter, partial [Pseudomonadota bacterium]
MNNAANPDRPLLGIMLMLAFCVMAPFGDALGKILGASLPILMIVAVRFLAQAVLLGPIALASGARPQ